MNSVSNNSKVTNQVLLIWIFLGGTCDIMEYYLERDDILLSQHQAWRPQAII